MVWNPFSIGHCPELNMSQVLGPHEASYYQSLIGLMMQIIEIEHIDVNTEVLLSSSYSAMLKQGHLEAMLYNMSYLKLRHNCRIAFDVLM